MMEPEIESRKQLREMSPDSFVSQNTGASNTFPRSVAPRPPISRAPLSLSNPGHTSGRFRWHRGNFRVIFKSPSRPLHLQIKCLAQDSAKVIVHYATNYRGAPGARGPHGHLTSL